MSVSADSTPAPPPGPRVEEQHVRDTAWTVPNLLSMLRLLGVPLFVWLLLGPHADLPALAVLIYSGASDWADGVIARRFNQQSSLGRLLDPAADRLYILAALVAFVLRGIVPWWLAVALVLRDVVIGAGLLVLRRHGYPPLQVHYLGKAATFCLLYGLPFLLLSRQTSIAGDIALPIGWAFTVWGAALYLWSGLLYLAQVVHLSRAARSEAVACAP